LVDGELFSCESAVKFHLDFYPLIPFRSFVFPADFELLRSEIQYLPDSILSCLRGSRSRRFFQRRFFPFDSQHLWKWRRLRWAGSWSCLVMLRVELGTLTALFTIPRGDESCFYGGLRLVLGTVNSFLAPACGRRGVVFSPSPSAFFWFPCDGPERGAILNPRAHTHMRLPWFLR